MVKRVLLVVLGALVAFLVVLAVLGKDAQEVKTEIEIQAPKEKVWALLTDIEGWTKWNPTVTQTSGQVALQAPLNITMIPPPGRSDGPNYQPVVIALEPHAHLRWRAHMGAGFIFTNDKILDLVPTESGGTKLVHRETFSGMMMPMMRGMMEEGVPPILNDMNAALKREAEKM